MNDRDAFIPMIADSWDDPMPFLVYADYAEENSLDDPHLLRWYGFEVMPALAAVSLDQAPANDAVRERARRALRPHPQVEVLTKLAAVAFCRRPEAWSNLKLSVTREAVAVTRLAALGLATPEERLAVFHRAVTEGKVLTGREPELERQLHESQTNSDREAAQQRLNQNRLLVEETLYAQKIAGAAGPNCAVRSLWDKPPGTHQRMNGWQAAICLALANVPRLTTMDSAPPPPVPSKRSGGRHQTLPGGFGFVVVGSVRYSSRLHSDQLRGTDPPPEKAFRPVLIEVRGPIEGCQRLVVAFGYPVWTFVGGKPQHPGTELIARFVTDALAAGWQPFTPGLADFPLDGRAYLRPASETTFG